MVKEIFQRAMQLMPIRTWEYHGFEPVLLLLVTTVVLEPVRESHQERHGR